MNSSQSVRIILLNWNGYQLTRECLVSLSSIEYDNFGITVVDNASTDGSIEKLRSEFRNVEFLSASANFGFAGGNNLGLRYVFEKHNPDFYLLLNNDTTVESLFLDRLVACFSNPHVGIAGPKIYFFDEPNRIWFAGGYFNRFQGDGKHFGYEEIDAASFDESRQVDFITGCCLMIRKEVVEKIGVLDNAFFAYCEDLDYCLRALDNGFKIMYQPSAVIYHKVSSSFKTTKTNRVGGRSALAYYLNVRNRIFVFRKHRRRINALGFLLFQLFFASRYFFGFLITLQFSKATTILRGIRDGIRLPLNKSSEQINHSPTPDESISANY